MDRPIALLLLPRRLEGFILHDQAHDLLRSPGVVAVEAPRVAHGALGRLPGPAAGVVASVLARRMDPPGRPAAALIFHPFQLPLAAAVLRRWPGCELWYGLFDRTPAAPDAGRLTRRRLRRLHEAAARRADLLFAVSPKLVELERAAGRDARLAPTAADSFPALDPGEAVVAVALGNLGRRTDWGLLRRLAEAMPELTVLLIGRVAEGECHGDPDYAACRALPGLMWLGRRSDEEAARLIACADVGLAPFRRDAFNDAGLPNRILKAARLGRRTASWDFAGVRVWSDAVLACGHEAAWVTALRSQRGKRAAADGELRAWALEQTAEHQNAALWERLEGLGVARPGP